MAADPDIRYTQSQNPLCIAKYRLAVDRPYKKDGQPSADFISCVAIGKNGEFAEKYLHKGMKVAVEGRIQTGSYKKDDGSTVYTTDVVAEHHEFCESRQGGSSMPEQYSKPQSQPQSGGFVDMMDDDSDLPF